MGRVLILCGDITNDNFLELADAVVLPTNPMMRFGSGVSGAIFKKVGIDILENYTAQTYGISYADNSRQNEMKPTDVRVTPGFTIPCDIIFAQGPKVYEYENYGEAFNLLIETYTNIAEVAAKHNYKVILLPALGTGSYGFTHTDTAQIVVKHLRSLADKFSLILILVIFTEEDAAIYRKNTD